MTSQKRRVVLLIAAVAVVLSGLTGCSAPGPSAGGASDGGTTRSTSGSPTSGSPTSGSPTSGSPTSGSPSTGRTGAATTALSGSITVFAAASLQKTFTTIGAQVEAAHPGITVSFSFAGSSDLVSQIQNGAPADVFASADEANMRKVRTDLVGSPQSFATNVLEIAVAPGNPKGIHDFADLDRSGVQVVTCAAPVPCGAATAAVERATGTDLHPVSEEQSVTDVLGKVESGQADAGLVYVTDVRGAAGKVDGVPFSASSKAVNTYPIGVLRDSENRALANAFVDAVRFDSGQRVLRDAGFGIP